MFNIKVCKRYGPCKANRIKQSLRSTIIRLLWISSSASLRQYFQMQFALQNSVHVSNLRLRWINVVWNICLSTYSHVKDTTSIRYCLHKGLGICTATSNMETRKEELKLSVLPEHFKERVPFLLYSFTPHLTPIMLRSSSFARSSNNRQVLSVAPNLTLRRQTAFESSVAMRKTSLWNTRQPCWDELQI